MLTWAWWNGFVWGAALLYIADNYWFDMKMKEARNATRLNQEREDTPHSSRNGAVQSR